ncbi:NAD(P)-binding protein [Stenotrophomonas maltophilia]|uniref:NAD(P)-binding protein n=1 Tax=Stenotrophomonas maltophilia TaxID=40324 RepID=UPI003D7E3A55
MKNYAIIGAGPKGLMAAVKLLDQGHSVTIYERDYRIGSMSANIVGDTRVDYVDINRTIKRVKKLHTVIVHILIGFFGFLLKVYSLFSSKPPFTADQLKALSAGDDFKGIDTEAVFGVKQTPFEEAIRESYTDPRYAKIVLER